MSFKGGPVALGRVGIGVLVTNTISDSASDSSLDPSDQEFGSGIALSKYRFPTGWFIVAFASDLAVGEVKRAHYFGEELVMFRTQSGQVHVMDAYCQHLGANMGVGGEVEGENIVCPWHGWRWRGDGTNAEIPYSKIGCKTNVRIRTYPDRRMVRLRRGVARAARPGAVLATAGTA